MRDRRKSRAGLEIERTCMRAQGEPLIDMEGMAMFEADRWA